MEPLVISVIILGCILLLLGIACRICGFRSVGVAANSYAAHYQSTIGNVDKGSSFAKLTSYGMRGCFKTFVILGLLILVAAGIYYLISYFF